MSSVVAASLRRVLIANKHQHLLVLSTTRTFSMQYKDTEKAAHPFDYVNKNYSKISFEKNQSIDLILSI
jgi:hypothetical protein